MYGYQNDNIIDKDYLLENYSQEEIFAIVFGDVVYKNQYVCSPFRKDTNPGCWFQYYKDELRFIDFGDHRRKYRNCFNVIQDMYELSLGEAIKLINDYFETEKTNNPNFQTSKYRKKNYKHKTKKTQFDIIIKPRFFNNQDKDYWTQFYIRKEQLIKDNIFPLIWYKTKGFFPEEILIRPYDIAYAISGFQSNHLKIYRPLFKGKRGKWFTNCNENDIGNIQNLPVTGKELILTKSYKDCRIIRNAGYNSIWFQNETCVPDLKILYDLTLRFSNIYTFFDNDTTGKSYSENMIQIFKNEFNTDINSFFTPDNFKDSGELIKKINEYNYKNFLNNKIKLK